MKKVNLKIVIFILPVFGIILGGTFIPVMTFWQEFMVWERGILLTLTIVSALMINIIWIFFKKGMKGSL